MPKILSYEMFIERLNGESVTSNTQNITVGDLQLITKKMSQLVAKSWLPEGNQIRSILLSKDSAKIIQMFKENDIDVELLCSSIEVDWSTFLGRLEDTLDNDNPLKLVIAYPPRPSEYNLSDDDLRGWVNDTNSDQKIPTHSYIPVTW